MGWEIELYLHTALAGRLAPTTVAVCSTALHNLTVVLLPSCAALLLCAGRTAILGVIAYGIFLLSISISGQS